jgi:dihydrofolate reductase
MGSRSFTGKLLHWPHGKRVVVLSSRSARELDVPPSLASTVSVAPSLKAAFHILLSEGLVDVAVVGASTIQRLWVDGWIDEVTLVLVPRTLGRGILLLGPDCKLVLERVRDLGMAGCLEICYKTSSN